ncbi:hypothetical protein IQ274_10985 [Nostoc sp. LEGE 12447]|uniref:hypothetical protein n=1 Tax=Nostoc sp. LEGE 12447 TaxID=1828640 RepID=UPI00188313B9|nr:hypothetical protein [Nostoc sp. LEGE 12447]MBE8998722.1 hypothetical protein [Nostoc sp. LEGE 12447]
MELRNFTGIALAIAELNQIMFTNHIDMSIFVSDRSKKFLVTQASLYNPKSLSLRSDTVNFSDKLSIF